MNRFANIDRLAVPIIFATRPASASRLAPRYARYTAPRPLGTRQLFSFYRNVNKWLSKSSNLDEAQADPEPSSVEQEAPTILEPAPIIMVAESPRRDMKAPAPWVTCNRNLLVLQIFDKGSITIERDDTKRFVVRWCPNKKSFAYESDLSDMPIPATIRSTNNWTNALKHGGSWVRRHFPQDYDSLSINVDWIHEAPTEKAVQHLYRVNGYRGSIYPDILPINGHRYTISELTKGQVAALIDLTLYRKRMTSR